MQQQQHVEQKPLLPALHAQLSSAQLSSAQALCQAIPVMTSSVWIDNIHMFHLDLGKFGNASKALMCWLSLASCRSPIRRISEVMLLVFVTSSLWFLVAYASPCKDLPPKVSAALLTLLPTACDMWILQECPSSFL